MLQEGENVRMEEKSQKVNLKHKSYLIILKYLPHFIALNYLVYTILLFLDIDLVLIGYLVNVSFTSWIFMLLQSIVFKFCYVHRLPLYYIALNHITSIVDYYFTIPVSDLSLLGIHLTWIGLLLFGYTLFYIKHRHNYVKFNKS